MTDRTPLSRVLLKLSGEAFSDPDVKGGIDPRIVSQVAREIGELQASDGTQIGIVVGGGNIFRGNSPSAAGMDRSSADHMGMLATVINALALQDAIERTGRFCRVMSAIRINQVCEDYIRRRAVRHLEKGRIVVFAAGTGNPFFTTDSAASLRAIEINAELMIKATKVDGVYDADPMKESSARRFERLTFDEALERRLGVMDTTALVMCRDNDLPLRVMNMFAKGDLRRLVMGEAVGTLVEGTSK